MLSAFAWLRPVVALDDDEIDCGHMLPQLDRFLVFGRLPTIQRRLVAWKFDDRIASAACALWILEFACADEKACAVCLTQQSEI